MTNIERSLIGISRAVYDADEEALAVFLRSGEIIEINVASIDSSVNIPVTLDEPIDITTAKSGGSYGQQSIGDSESSIIDASAFTMGVIIKNVGDYNVYIGETGLSAGTESDGDAWELVPGEWISLEIKAHYYGICNTGESSRVCYWGV